MKKFMKYAKIIGGAIVSILGILLAAKAMNTRKQFNKKVAKNDGKIKEIESSLVKEKAKKKRLQNKLEKLKTTADGRSKEVKEAKKKANSRDGNIADLEAELAAIEKGL